MFHALLQVWGGMFYLLNKIFFSRAERTAGGKRKQWQVRSWRVYLTGLPAWATLFFFERNWIAMMLELGGAPSMILGLVNAYRGKSREPKWLNYVAITAIVIGLGYSIYDFGGINTINQGLELSLTAGFLLGTYLLAKEHATGYLCFMVMNISCAALMYVQGFYWLTFQQAVSLGFVVDAYRMHRHNNAHKK